MKNLKRNKVKDIKIFKFRVIRKGIVKEEE